MKKYLTTPVIVALIVGMVVGMPLGGIVVAKSKAAELAGKASEMADIIAERNEELTALQAKHKAELAAAYASFKEKGADVLANMPAEEIGAIATEEVNSAIQDAGDTVRTGLDSLKNRFSSAEGDSSSKDDETEQ